MSIGPTRKAASSIAPPDSLRRVGAVALEQAVLDDDRQAEGHQKDRQNALADRALEQEALQHVARQEATGTRISATSNGDQPSAPVSDRMTNENSTIMSPCAMLTKRMTPSEQRQAEREQRIEAADQHALDQEVEKGFGHFAHAPK